MKRDCGEGALIPIRFMVMYSPPFSDDEKEFNFNTLQEAETKFNEIDKILSPASFLGLYAKDNQGYANCILSKLITVHGELHVKDRRSEL